MDERNREVGMTIRRLRNTMSPEMSQDKLAVEMQLLGNSTWSQSTVWAVEQGRRPLRYTELMDLARILNVSVIQLTNENGQIPIMLAIRELDISAMALVRSAVAFDQAQQNLEALAAERRMTPSDLQMTSELEAMFTMSVGQIALNAVSTEHCKTVTAS